MKYEVQITQATADQNVKDNEESEYSHWGNVSALFTIRSEPGHEPEDDGEELELAAEVLRKHIFEAAKQVMPAATIRQDQDGHYPGTPEIWGRTRNGTDLSFWGSADLEWDLM